MGQWKFLNYNLLVICTACLFATTVDIPFSWTSPVIPKLQSNDTSDNPLGRPITEDEDSWLGSLVSIGAMIGPFVFSFVTEKFGRKVGLLSASVPIIISFFILAFSKHIYLYYFARILAGLSMGGGYALLPIYVAEVSEDHNRGRMSQSLNIFWSLGSFTSYAIGPFTSMLAFNIILGCIPTTFFVGFLILAPESPYYLVSEGKVDKARKALKLLRSKSDDEVEDELQKLRDSVKKETIENGSIWDIFTSTPVRKAGLICTVLLMTQELCGFVAILFYLQPIFEAAGTALPGDISALIVGVFILTSSFINPFFVDRTGRRSLCIVSCLGMCVALTLLGTFFYLQTSTDVDTEPIFWLPLVSLIMFIFAFNFGISSMPWTLTSELFPPYIKNVASNAMSILSWTTSFVITKFFNTMNDGMGRAGTFWVFAGFCLFSGIFSIFLVPETKGLSFSQIQEILQYGGWNQLKFGKEEKVRIELMDMQGLNKANGEGLKPLTETEIKSDLI